MKIKYNPNYYKVGICDIGTIIGYDRLEKFDKGEFIDVTEDEYEKILEINETWVLTENEVKNLKDTDLDVDNQNK